MSKYMICHGLGETPRQWEPILNQIPVSVGCPDLFHLAQVNVLTYQELYAAFAQFCDSQSGLLNLCGLSLGGVLALSYASSHIEKMESLILIGTPYIIPRFAFAFQNILFHLMPRKVFSSMGLTKKSAIRLTQSMVGLDIPHMASAITCRTLILCGEKDQTNMQGAISLHRVIKQSQFAVIKKAGHQVNLDAPETLAGKIQSFWMLHSNF